jgi:high-affinity nickel permease
MAQGAVGKIRSSVAVILLSIITFGIYSIYWQYKSFKELKDYTGQGIGGGLALLFAIILAIVNVFMLPAEVGNMYQASGRDKPVSGKTGWWVFLPLVGFIIWVVKVQGSLNRYWDAQPTPLAAAA